MRNRLVVAFLSALSLACAINSSQASGEKPNVSGGVPVRIPNGPTPVCINASTDKVWLTLYRIVETKKKGFFTSENQAEIVTTVKVQSDPQPTQPLSFPLSVKVNTRPYSDGQVSLPVEYTLVSGLSLTQKSGTQAKVVYTGFAIDTTLVNLKSKNGLGSALSALATITGSNKVPIPSNPYSQAATYLLGFANTAIQNDIDAKNADDKYTSDSLALNFSTENSCTGGPDEAGFETTGTKAILMSDGIQGDGYVPIDQTNTYCWTAEVTPSFVLKAAKIVNGKACSDSSYSALYKQVTNNFLAFFLQKQTVSAGQLGGPSPRLQRDKQDAKRLCDVLGVKNCPAAK
jgi:hypothetical protein